ncbi:MAG: hypothetical protein EXR65_00290 [Dehalococcoidia bacterium]|nr:hypothetical protein [Dehalococcoidia bacterium]
MQQQLAEPRGGVERARQAVDALRDGGALRVELASAAASRRATAELAAGLPYAGGDGGTDHFGWRSLTRRLGEDVVVPGFGMIFEQQINQESGFAPEVAFGLRRSRAGAEGIAQLMPQYYPGVDRADPQASLNAAALTMKHYLAAFDGDTRKALAAYNAGLGRVQALVQAHGDDWQRALPLETR